MATTRISDIIVPEVFFNYMAKDTTEKTELFRSGIIRPDGELSAKLGGGGRTFNVPFWKDLDNTESGVASDDPSAFATAGTISTGKDIARRQLRTRAWSTADLAAILAGSDPMARIQARVTAYWDRQFQLILRNTLTGLFADNVANDSGDMVNDISNDSSATATSAELVSAEAIIDTAHTMGDNASSFRTLVMHSNVVKRLKKLNLIDYIPDSEGRVNFATYLDYRVVIDDGVRTVQGSNRVKYWTYLVGESAMGWAEVAPETPVEVHREPLAGNGMGIEYLITRRQFVMHPYGIKWTDSSVSGQFPSNADLATTANWDRVYVERKQIPIAALVTNG